jgi:hypothetical protein
MFRWFIAPTVEEILQRQIEDAQRSLLEQKAYQESANANVTALTARLKRLERDLENLEIFGTLTPDPLPGEPQKVNLVVRSCDCKPEFAAKEFSAKSFNEGN